MEEKSEVKELRAEIKRLRIALFLLSKASSREQIREALRTISREELAKAGIV